MPRATSAKKSAAPARESGGEASKSRASKKKSYAIKPIGVIRTPFPEPKGTPISASRAYGARGMVWIDRQYRDALLDLDGFDRIWLIYWLHKAPKGQPLVRPFIEEQQHGLFATRAPMRFNAIGMSAVRVLEVHGDRIDVADVDIVDGAPLLDIKPYIPEFDSFPGSSAGWCEDNQSPARVDDGQFLSDEVANTRQVFLSLEGLTAPEDLGRIENMLKELDGVIESAFGAESVDVSYDMRRQGPGRIIRAIKALGYGARNAKKPLL